MNHPFPACQFRIGSGNRHHFIINIISLDIGFQAIINLFPGLFQRILPVFRSYDMFPLLRCKAPVHTRCYIRCHHRRFNRYRSTATERIYQYSISFPRSQHNQRRCQIFRNRRLGRQLPVSPLMQRLSRRIQPHCNFVFQQKDTDGKRCTVLLKPVDMIDIPESLYHRLFYNGLDIGRTEKSTFYTGRLCHPEFSILRNILFPRQCPDSLKQFLIRLRMKAANLNQNPLCRPQKHICPNAAFFISKERNTPVLHRCNIISQVCYFSFQWCLKPKMAGHDQFKFSHMCILKSKRGKCQTLFTKKIPDDIYNKGMFTCSVT